MREAEKIYWNSEEEMNAEIESIDSMEKLGPLSLGKAMIVMGRKILALEAKVRELEAREKKA